jgi:hypothetical protein
VTAAEQLGEGMPHQGPPLVMVRHFPSSLRSSFPLPHPFPDSPNWFIFWFPKLIYVPI